MAYYLYKKYIKDKNTNSTSLELCGHHASREVKNDLKTTDLPHDSRARDHEAQPVRSNEAQLPKGSGRGESKPRDLQNSCLICAEEKKTMRKYRTKIVIGLFLPFLVQSLDTTLISGALPFIASDFKQLSQLNWIVSAFNLTFATFIPFWAQFADVFGRYVALQLALSSLVLGSILCSACPTSAFPLFLFGRGIQGLGCAGLLIISKAVLADKVSLKENAKNNTIFTVVAAIGYGTGPVIGGYLTNTSWRYCFIINIPIGVVGILLAHFVLRSELLGPQKITSTNPDENTNIELPQDFVARLHTIDYIGQILFLFGMGLFILALTWAGSSYTWSSANVLAPLIIGVILLILFSIWEYSLLPDRPLSLRFPTRRPMIPLNLLFTRNAGLLIYINLITGMAMYAVFYFVDLYFALIKTSSPGQSGKNLLYYTPGLGVGAYLAVIACTVYPLQTVFPLFLGTVLEPIGITILAIAVRNDHQPLLFGMLGLTGVGTGIRFMPGTLHGIAYFPNQIASIVALMSLAISLGGTLATTIMLNIFNNHLSSFNLSFGSGRSSSFIAIQKLSPVKQEIFRERAKEGIVLAFFAITAFMWLGVLAVAGLGNVKIGRKGEDESIVEKGSWLGYVLNRKGEGKREES